MKHKKPPVPVIVLLVIAILVGGYYGVKALTGNGNQPLLVSGTIEATEITISPEMAGKVLDVLVDEGAAVKTYDPLFRMDDSLLQGQRAVAAAGLDSARAASATATAALETAKLNYTLALNAARLEAAASRTLDWTAATLPGYTLPAGYFLQQDLLAAAGTEVEAARTFRDATADTFTTNLGVSANADFMAAEARLLTARMAEQSAQDALTRANLSSNLDLRNAAQYWFDVTKIEMNSAQSAYDDLKDSDAAQQIIAARMDLTIAQERYEAAQDRLLKLQTGEASPKLKAARAALNQAELTAAQMEATISQTEAQLALLDLQISKLTVLAPSDGVILTRSIQPGEMVSAAAAALKLGRLDDLSITVYVPEDIYGTLSLGQLATLTVDSYPGQSFSARIVHIADQAEFTPRNVQTVEGRKATVFAVRLKVEDTGGKLKPGMPADITFNK
jgi:multidrug resistance efflux pump